MKKILLTIASGLIGFVGFAQLSGTYTVNGAQATGGTNYQTFSAAFSALTSQGVNGPVVFNCIQGTYTEQVYSSSQSISGASTTNTITFQAAAANTNEVLWQYSSYPLYLYNPNNISNLTFDGIHFKTTGASNAIRIYYGTLTNVTFENCEIEGYAAGTNTSNSYATVYMYFTTANNVTFENNEITNGSYGLYLYYLQSSSVTNVIGNDVTNWSAYGVYNYSGYYPKWIIKDNTITDDPNGYQYSYALYAYYMGAGSEVSGNYVEATGSSGCYGMIGYYSQGNSSNPVLVYNNIFNLSNANTSYYQYGMLVGYCYYAKYHHNTIRITNTYTGSYAAYMYFSSTAYVGNEFKNNIVVSEQTGPRTMYSYVINSTGLSMDNNVYSMDGGSDINNYNVYSGTTSYTIAAWQSSVQVRRQTA